MSRKALANYRAEKAEELLKDAEDALKRERYMLSVNRSYYAMFTSARALLAMVEKDSSKHSRLISFFNQCFVKSGIFLKKLVDSC